MITIFLDNDQNPPQPAKFRLAPRENAQMRAIRYHYQPANRGPENGVEQAERAPQPVPAMIRPVIPPEIQPVIPQANRYQYQPPEVRYNLGRQIRPIER